MNITTTLVSNMKNNMNIIRLERSNPLFFYIAKKFIWHILFSTCFIISLYSSGLYAEPENKSETHKVSITAHEFEEWSFTPRPGDIIEITNRAKISHSIYIINSDGETINIDTKLFVQIPGSTIKWTIPAAGEYTLKCWIHPSIHATLLVAE